MVTLVSIVLYSQEVEVSLSEWELGVASGLNDMKEKLSLCEVRDARKVHT